MTRQKSRRRGHALWIILAELAVILVGSKLYTDTFVRQAEARYSPFEFVTVEGLRLHYVSQGSGKPVVIIHGGSGNVRDFTVSPMFDQVAQEYRAIAVDRPGLGYSDLPPKAEYIEDGMPVVQARIIHDAMQELGVEKPVLIGQSWGGAVALAYALEYPDDLSGIVLLGSSPYPSEPSPAGVLDVIDGIVRTPVIGDLVVHTVYVPIGHLIVAPMFVRQAVEEGVYAPFGTIPPGLYDEAVAMQLRPSHIKASAGENDSFALSFETKFEELSQRYDEIGVPVVIMVGKLDTHALEQAPRLDEDIPNSSVIVVPDTGHYIWFAHPEEIMDAIRKVWELAD
jgi:pimeloyl-ACP methyl ester carboxylesterase